jgi:hypothetical protein
VIGVGRPRSDIHLVIGRATPGSAESPPERCGVAEAISVQDEDFQAALRSAGYTADTIALAELAPQIEIAWTDGRVSTGERAVILEAATDRGIRPYGRAHAQLARWLERRPPKDFFRVSRERIKRMFRRLPAHLQANVRRSLLRECVAVAQASGGLLGWNSVSKDEQQVIDSLASDLDSDHPPNANSEGNQSAGAPSTGHMSRGCSDSVAQPRVVR